MVDTKDHILIPKVYLSECINKIRQGDLPPYNIMLVNGSPMDREVILNSISNLSRERWNILSIRLFEDITDKEAEFSLYLMRYLAQEMILIENLPSDLTSLINEYLHPFEIKEKIKKVGIVWKLSMGKEEKLVRKERNPEEVRRDCIFCCEFIRETDLKPILIINSVENLSNSSKSFLIEFLNIQGRQGITIIGGSNEKSLQEFVESQGISKYFRVSLITSEPEEIYEREENDFGFNEHDSDVMQLASVIKNAFASEALKFNYLKFEVIHQLKTTDFQDNGFNFDLCLLGHLRMRQDFPELIRTDYDCALIIKILNNPITDMASLQVISDQALKILMNGVTAKSGRRFEPWDSFLFLATPDIDQAVIDEYQHKGYRNIFIILKDQSFINLSPHEWMSHILNNIAVRWWNIIRS